MIEGHGLNIDSNNIVIAESISGQMDVIQPIQVYGLKAAA
jgi:hypothetical protein